jgi:uncharacterized protein YbjT (DUF2867 family)
MDRSKCSIVVTGATGRQGGAVARKLIDDGWDVCAFVRDADKPASRALAGLGANLLTGDLNDADSVNQAVDGAYGVFSVQTWANGVDVEERQGKIVADAAASARVEHFIYSSVGGSNRGTGVPHFESKWRVEQYIHEVALPYTIFRPAYFMENLLNQRESVCDGHLAPPMNPDVPLQFVAIDDIASFVAMAFRSPGSWLGHSPELAGDELTFLEVAGVLSARLGRDVEVRAVVRPAEPERQVMARWFEDYGYDADISELRATLPSLHTFESWAAEKFACTPLEQ